MGNTATTIDRQIELLRSRGMTIHNTRLARHILTHVGYFRLGYYWFPFERTYPRKDHRDHIFIPGTDLTDVETLYRFDLYMRGQLFDALSQI